MSLVPHWQRGTFPHGILVLPINLYMIWRDRRQLPSLSSTQNPGGLGYRVFYRPSCSWAILHPYRAKFLQLKARLVGGPPAAAWIVFATAFRADAAAAAATVRQDFLRHTSLKATLKGTSE